MLAEWMALTHYHLTKSGPLCKNVYTPLVQGVPHLHSIMEGIGSSTPVTLKGIK